MAFQTSRQSSSVLSRTLRPSPISPASTRLVLASPQHRCINQEHSSKEKSQSKRTPAQLPYTPLHKSKNIRPQPQAPFAHRNRKSFSVNDDAQKLDDVFLKLAGKDLGLTNEVKWQAVTHKSFDHGRQPFNSKLTFLGKRILQMQTAFYLLSSPLMLRSLKPTPTTYRSLDGTHYEQPEPFLHNDYKSLENVTSANIDAIMDAKRLEPLINESGLIEIMRWKPARVTDVIGSGQMAIAIECLFAIVGAVALQKGGDVAARLAREKILGKNKP